MLTLSPINVRPAMPPMPFERADIVWLSCTLIQALVSLPIMDSASVYLLVIVDSEVVHVCMPSP
eukprot:scaffold366172_cov23-Prasinocladus_malaysianus.AAC.1